MDRRGSRKIILPTCCGSARSSTEDSMSHDSGQALMPPPAIPTRDPEEVNADESVEPGSETPPRPRRVRSDSLEPDLLDPEKKQPAEEDTPDTAGREAPDTAHEETPNTSHEDAPKTSHEDTPDTSHKAALEGLLNKEEALQSLVERFSELKALEILHLERRETPPPQYLPFAENVRFCMVSFDSPTDEEAACRYRSENPLFSLRNPRHGLTTYGPVPTDRLVTLENDDFKSVQDNWGIMGNHGIERDPEGSMNGNYLKAHREELIYFDSTTKAERMLRSPEFYASYLNQANNNNTKRNSWAQRVSKLAIEAGNSSPWMKET